MADRRGRLLTGDALDVGDRRRGVWRARLTAGFPFLLKRGFGAAWTVSSNSEGARPSRRLHGGSGGSLLRLDVDEGRRPSPLPPAPSLLPLLLLYLSTSKLILSSVLSPFLLLFSLLVSSNGRGWGVVVWVEECEWWVYTERG